MARASWILACAAAVLLRPGAALAVCSSNAECKAPRICSAGQCTNPPPASLPCDKDVDCPGDQVCESHQCTAATPPPEATPAPQPRAEPAPQLTPTPSGPAPAPAEPPPPARIPNAPPPSGEPPPPPEQPPPPPHARPASPPPGYNTPSQPPASIYTPSPQGYWRPKPVKPIGWKFDLLAGPAVLLSQGDAARNYATAAGLGGAFDVGLGYGFAPNFGFGLRGGGIISQWPVQMFYVGPGFFMPVWHWGFYVTAANLGMPDGHGREWGVHLELPYEFRISRWFQIDLAVGLGFYRDATEETIRLEFGI